MDRIMAPKGQPTRIVKLVASTVPCEFTFSARKVDGDAARGEVEVVTRRLFRARREVFPLQGQNSFEKLDPCLSYRITVTPEDDTMLMFEETRITARHLYKFLALIAVVVAAALAAPYVIQFINAL